MKKSLLIVNLGTPNKPTYFSVFKYLRQFLMDGRVIDRNLILRFILVNLIIVPLRSFSSSKIYQQVWDKNTGSPLLHNTKKLTEKLKDNFLLITADTIVILNDLILNKPKNHIDAYHMLSKLSNQTHKVITGVCIKSIDKEILFTSITNVKFRELSKIEINYYIKNYNPLDKSGGYGIQEWIGQVGIESIKGSYFNVVGLPLSKLYENLKKF